MLCYLTYRYKFYPLDCFTVDRVRGDVTISRQILVSPRTPVVGNITIFATDGGGLESNVTLQVEIVDVNNHAPEFTAPKFNFIPILEVSFMFYLSIITRPL